jgi:hypothetical protein
MRLRIPDGSRGEQWTGQQPSRHRVDANPTCADARYCLQAGDSGKLFRNPSLKNFSPRAGFAWDVRGDGKTAVVVARGPL